MSKTVLGFVRSMMEPAANADMKEKSISIMQLSV